MGLRAILRSAKESVSNVIKKVAKITAATSLVIFKTGAGAGQAIFGGKKQIRYVEDQARLPLPDGLEKAYIATIVSFTVVTSVLTRAPNTFRSMLGKDYPVKLGLRKAPAIEEKAAAVPQAKNDREAANSAMTYLDDESDEKESTASPVVVYLNDEKDHSVQSIFSYSENDLHSARLNNAIAGVNQGNAQEDEEEEEEQKEDAPPIDPALSPSSLRLFLHTCIDSFVTACSLSSTYFTTINSYNFGKQLMAWLMSIDPDTTKTSEEVSMNMLVLLQLGALGITVGNLYSNYYYNSAKARAWGFRFANWSTNLAYNEETNSYKITEYNRLTDMAAYKWAIAFTAINFGLSEPANAFFTTMNSLPAIPGMMDVFSEDSIKIISACSTATAVVQNIFTNVPSVKNLLEPEPEVKAALEKLPDFGKRLLRFGQLCGSEDSLITGFSYFIAMTFTANKLNPDISLTDPVVMLVAAVCGTIKVMTNQGFSVNPALIDLLEDIYPEIFQKERDRAKINREMALNAARQQEQQVREEEKTNSVRIAMPPEAPQPKVQDLKEKLLSDEPSPDTDSDSSDDDRRYQPPVRPLAAKSSPNLLALENDEKTSAKLSSAKNSATKNAPYVQPRSSLPASPQLHNSLFTPPVVNSLENRMHMVRAQKIQLEEKKANEIHGHYSEPLRHVSNAIYQSANERNARMVHSSHKEGFFSGARKKKLPINYRLAKKSEQNNDERHSRGMALD